MRVTSYLLSAGGVRRGEAILDAPSDLRVFHGTDIESARSLLEGTSLDVGEAAARKIDGSSGFFLATELEDAIFFALRRQPGGVLQIDLSAEAVRQLQVRGLIRRPIPQGPRSPHFLGDELIVPLPLFDLFNCLRCAGEIVVSSA